MGFDYLRDNMAIYKSQMVQRGHAFAIVDEVDSILIDEARTPLIISGQGDESTDLYRQAEDFAARLTCKSYASIDDKEEEDEDLDADYVVDEKPAPRRSPPAASPRPRRPSAWKSRRHRKRHARAPHRPGHQRPRHHEARH